MQDNRYLVQVNQSSQDLVRGLPKWRAWQAIKERLANHLGYLGGILLAALLAGSPGFQFKVIKGDDAREYLPQTVEF